MAKIFISGASSDIGAAAAKLFAKEGNELYLHYYQNEAKADALIKELERTPGLALHLLRADFANQEDLFNLCGYLKRQKIDIVILNAATNNDVALEEKTYEDFSHTISVNLNASFLLAKELGFVMKEQKKGSILFVSSTNAVDTYYPESIDYDASKAGLISLMQNLATAFAPYVRVNTILPGWIDTSKVSDMNPMYRQEEEQKILLQRFATPEEIAKVIYFLCSEDASYITNTTIRVDGGSK